MSPRHLGVVALALAGMAGCVTTSDTPSASTPAAEPPSIAFDVKANVYAKSELKPGATPIRASREGSLWMIIEREESKLRTAGNLVRDQEVNAYIRDVVCRLAGPFCGDVRTYVVRVPEFNATMSPNGMMMVWSGLLLRVRNESQLAAVLGHEIGHFLQRHGLKRMEDSIDKTNALIVAQIAFAIGGIPLAGDLAALGVYGSIAAFSRDNERQADDIGLRIMIQQGYDPREAAKLWDQFLRELKAEKDYRQPPFFLASHPANEERSATLTGMANYALKEAPPIQLGRESYLKVIGPLRDMFIEDELKLRRFERLEVLLGELAEDGWGLGRLRFYQGELHRLRNDEGDLDKAIAFYRQSVAERDHPTAVHRSLGRSLSLQGKRDEAGAAFRRYLELEPGAPDRAIIEMMISGAS